MQAGIKSFYLFGDSICYGQLVGAHQTWATMLARTLNEMATMNQPLLVQNTGVNGNTTRQALERIHYDVTSHSPDIVMVQFGMNDCNYWVSDKGLPRVSPKAFVANLEEIVGRAIASGAQHCFLNTNHPSLKGEFSHIKDKTYDQSNAEYSDLIRAAYDNLEKQKFPVTMVDIEAEWHKYLSNNVEESLGHLLLADGIHLSARGHQLYMEIVIPKVTALLLGME